MNTDVDPVCGMSVDPAKAAGKFEYKGTTYYFCSLHCLNKFSADPQSYLNKTPQHKAGQLAAMQQAQHQAHPATVQLGGKSKAASSTLPMMMPVATSTDTAEVDPVCGIWVDRPLLQPQGLLHCSGQVSGLPYSPSGKIRQKKLFIIYR